MKKWGLLVVFLAAVGVTSACGSDGGTVGPGGETLTDVLPDLGGDIIYGCKSADECKGKTAPGQCQKVDCIDNKCVIVPDTSLNGQPCEPENKCLESPKCFEGKCGGTPKECSDGNVCTDDRCNESTGLCEFIPNNAPCNDGNLCTINDRCSEGVCKGGESICECTIDEDCKKYDDADLCNGVLKCINKACKTDPATVVDCSNTPTGPCEVAVCIPATGECGTKPKPDGTSCDDGNACTTDTVCKAGECKGMPLKCDDKNKCTKDSCDPAGGCVFTPEPDGTPCNDGNLCTKNDVCKDGVCTGEPVEECNACTSDADCQPFEDGNLCNGTLKCIDGSCQVDESTIIVCPDPGNQCSEAKCIPATGECVVVNALDGSACDDQNLCTTADYCSGGVCKGLPVNCDDNNSCTADSCDPDSGCLNVPTDNKCDDGDPCTINDQCENGVCTGAPNPACQCNTHADCAKYEDGNFCNGTLVCKQNTCQVDPATVVVCQAPPPGSCQTVTCEPPTGACIVSQLPDASACDDGDACTEGDACLAGKCVGKPISCDDDNICTTDSCDKKLGCVHLYNAADCDDGNPCTTDDHCEQGMCIGTPDPSCVCTENSDCAQFDDGNKCNGTLICVEGKCVVDPDSIVVCDKSNDTDCMVTYCVPETGNCTQAAFEDGKPCNDGNACTLVDTCSGGKCVGTLSPDCDDGNPCTDDSCDPKLGCIAVPNNADCDDGDPCTGGDKCVDGVCQPGPQVLCGNTCIPDWTIQCGETDSWGNDMEGATDNVDSYWCSPFPYEGPEYTYTFTAPYDAEITVTLSKEEADTDVIVLENAGFGCDPQMCRDWDYSQVTFEAAKGESYFFVVDGYAGGFLPAAGSFTITVECKPYHEIDCEDGLDEDGDQLVDCADPDCQGSPSCPAPLCEPAWSLDCGETDSWWNDGFGSTSAISTYPCAQGKEFGGSEYTYVFVSPVTKPVTVKLTYETADTALFVLSAGPDGVCSPDQCIDFGLTQVTFNAEAGQSYYIVVDAPVSVQGKYTIKVICPPEVETECDNSKDDDKDGKIDCDDPDCLYSEACSQDCTPMFSLNISCGFQENYYNYSWTSSNKADSYACTEDPETGPEEIYTFQASTDVTVTVTLSNETAETDILVVEATDEGDCLTVNCIAFDMEKVEFKAEKDAVYYIIVDGYDGAEGSYHIDVQCKEAAETICDNGMDDDGDGAVDCLDADCFPGPECQPPCEPDTGPMAQLSCGSEDSWFTDGPGSTDLIDAYSCNSYDYSGPEYTYTLTVDKPTTVVVALSNEVDADGESVELDILVLQDEGLGCNPASCIAYGFDSVTFNASPDETYYVVIDGWHGAVGSYDLKVSCE